MRELSLCEIEGVSGGGEVDWGQVFGGIGVIAIGITLTALAPASTVVVLAASAISYTGGVGIGYAVNDAMGC